MRLLPLAYKIICQRYFHEMLKKRFIFDEIVSKTLAKLFDIVSKLFDVPYFRPDRTFYINFFSFSEIFKSRSSQITEMHILFMYLIILLTILYFKINTYLRLTSNY